MESCRTVFLIYFTKVFVGLCCLAFISPTLAMQVSVTKTSNTTASGQYIYHRVIVANDDSSTRTNVVLYANVSADSYFSGALPGISGGCTNACDSGETARWELGSIAPGTYKVIVIPFYTSGSLTTGSEVSLTTTLDYDGLASSIVNTATSTITNEPIVAMHLGANKQLAAAGEQVNFEVTYGNIGTYGLASPSVEVMIPDGMTYVNASDGGSFSGGKITWDLSALNTASGGKLLFSLQNNSGSSNADIDEITASFISNSVTLVESAESVVTYNDAGLTFTSTIINEYNQPGNYAYMRYVVANNSAFTVNDVKVFQRNSATQYFSIPRPGISGGCTNACDANEWARWELGDIAAGDSKVIVVPVYTSGASAGSPVESMLMVTEASGRYFLGTKPAFLTEAEEGMQLVLSPEKQVIGANEEVRYKISVGNTGTDAVTGLTLKMPVPENMTYVSSSDNGNVIDGNVVWTINTMNPAIGDTRFVTFLSNADLNNGDVLETEAWLETTQRLQRSTDSLVIRNNIALTLTATVLGDQRQYNHFAYFKYVIANEGALNISDVSLYINTASRTSYRQVSPGLTGGCTNECDSGEWGRWEFGTLAPGESRVVTVPVGMTSNVFGEPLESHALVTEGSGRYTLSLRPTVVNQSEAGMQLSMTPDKQMLEPGDVVEYQLAYGNTGADALTSGTLVMPIPAGMTYLSSSDNGEFTGDQVSWNLATVNPGIGNLRTVKLQVGDDLPEGSVVAFESMILNPDRIQRSTDSVVITDNLDLTLTTTVSKEMHQNGFYTYYHYTVANKGMLDIADIQMWMKTGLRTNFSNAMPRISGGCTNECDANEWARWEIGTLSPGESSVITIPLYSSNPIVGEPLESHVAVRDASGKYWLGTRPTLIARDTAVMDVALTSTTSLVEPGETQEFTFVYGNPTSDTFENALLSLPLPVGYTLQQASGTYELVDDTVYWPLGDIAPNKGGQLSVSLVVDSNITSGEVLKLHASLDSGGNIHQSTGSSIATTVAGSLPFSLDVDSDYTTPLVPYSVLDTILTANVLSQTQLANVRMFALTSQYTTAANTGMTGGCTNSCDSGEWARWEMGNLDAGHQEAKFFTQTASGSLFGGKLLISNYMLFTDSSPNLTQAIMHVAPAGDSVTVNALEDTDGDGIPDWWEIRYMPYMNWLDSADAAYDADSDGYSNYDEYANDKIPTDDISTPDDFDGDLISDLLDEDDDNDGYPDTEDAYPFDASKHRLVKNDVNGDGNSDILWRSYTKGWNFLWAMDGTATASTTPINVVPGTAWDMVGQGDYDADGKSDIFWRNNDTGQNFIYLMDGAVYKSRYTLNYVGATDWRVAGSGDFDGDGKGDVLWRNINRGDTWFYLMDAGVIRDSLPSLLVADTDYEIVATGDIDGDGDDDVIWRHSVSGVNYIWLMQGGSIVSRYTLNTVNTEWDIAGTGDLDGDGTDDIILRNQVSGENWVYFMEAGQIRESAMISTVADTNWQIANIGDYDGDGKSDFLWRHAADARNIIHLMDGTTRKASGVLKNTDDTWKLAR